MKKLKMSAKNTKTVFVVYYSTFGHVEVLARQICIGLEKAGGFFPFRKNLFYFKIKGYKIFKFELKFFK